MSSDDLDGVRKLRQKVKLTLPVYSDPERVAIRAWGVEDKENEISLPATFVVDAEGRVVYAYVGGSKDDRPSWDEVFAAVRAATEPAARPTP